MVPSLFEHEYQSLPEELYQSVSPTPVEHPELIIYDRELAQELDLPEELSNTKEGIDILSGCACSKDSLPIALAYAGHQFGHFVPQLGDGRAILLGERRARNGKLYDVHLKGSGQTPYSRNGDGRSPLGPVIREYLVSNAMHALGVPSTRALAALRSGEQVRREQRLAGGIMIRIASSHIRIGTFEYLACRHRWDTLEALIQFAAARHHPETLETDNVPLAFLEAVINAQASLIAQWMQLGFVHGVMNTDNMTVSGETIDYGPCAFIDAFKPDAVFSSIDTRGRYAYSHQPLIARWNLTRLAECILPLVDTDKEQALEKVQAVVDAFPQRFDSYWLQGMSDKCGVLADEASIEMMEALLDLMHRHEIDFTRGMRSLSEAVRTRSTPEELLQNCSDQEALHAWYPRWDALVEARLERTGETRMKLAEQMDMKNPLYIPRNHIVEDVIEAAYAEDYAPLKKFSAILKQPYQQQASAEQYTQPAPEGQNGYKTFCGT